MCRIILRLSSIQERRTVIHMTMPKKQPVELTAESARQAFGAHLSALMVASKMDPARLHVASGVSLRSIENYRAGKTWPQLDSLILISLGLRCPVEALLPAGVYESFATSLPDLELLSRAFASSPAAAANRGNLVAVQGRTNHRSSTPSKAAKSTGRKRSAQSGKLPARRAQRDDTGV